MPSQHYNRSYPGHYAGYVWKLRGFKVFQNLPISVALYSDAPISDAPIFAHLVEHLEEHLNK